MLVTVTATGPATDAGLCTERDVAATEAPTLPATPPNLTTTPDLKPVPVMVTTVLPVVGPLAGEMVEIVGAVTAACTYVNAVAIVTEPPSGLTTVIVTGPAAPAGLVTLIVGRREGGDRASRRHQRAPLRPSGNRRR